MAASRVGAAGLTVFQSSPLLFLQSSVAMSILSNYWEALELSTWRSALIWRVAARQMQPASHLTHSTPHFNPATSFDLPSVSNWVSEGYSVRPMCRAGRDGKEAEALLYYSKVPPSLVF